jgi:uncharacterized protein YggE
MRRSIIVPALALLVARSSATRAQASFQLDTGRTIVSATGQARQTVAPDRATLMIMIDAQAMTADEAATKLGSVERGVLDTLRRFGFASGAVQSFNSGVVPYRQPNMGSSMMGGPTFSGRAVVRVETTRLDQVSAVTSAALAKGASYISPPTFSSSNADSVRRVLLPRALEQAQRDAEALARAAGGRLGRLLDVNAPSAPINFATEQNQMVFFGSIYGESGPRPAPSSTISTTVTARWLLIPNGR